MILYECLLLPIIIPGLDSFSTSGATICSGYGFLGTRQSLESLRPHMRESLELSTSVTTDLSLAGLSSVLDRQFAAFSIDYGG